MSNYDTLCVETSWYLVASEMLSLSLSLSPRYLILRLLGPRSQPPSLDRLPVPTKRQACLSLPLGPSDISGLSGGAVSLFTLSTNFGPCFGSISVLLFASPALFFVRY